MITINVYRDKKGFPWQILCEGHAGYGEEGNDIVCSAATILTTNTGNAIEKLVGISTDKTLKIKDGYILVSVPTDVIDEKKHDIKVIMETAIIGLKEISLSYKNYIEFFEEEV